MPELPEVETMRLGLSPVMTGARFLKVEARRPDLRFPLPKAFARRLAGAEVQSLSRRGKYLIAPLSTGESLIMHLGMSGHFRVEQKGAPCGGAVLESQNGKNPKHDHIIFELSGAGRARIIYNDPRRFGFMDLASTRSLSRCRHFRNMGLEPLGEEFTEQALIDAFATRQAPVKTALLDQRAIAGLGNIYVCEALFRAKISPRRKAATIRGSRAARLSKAIVAVLRDAIEAGGSSLRDYAKTDGRSGYFQHKFDVYDRANEKCRLCGSSIRRIVQSGRSTFYCPRCQR